ncbi:hypothetical protein WR25_02231 [Diploscapter pachys]|uniref:Uncharacterized protein n=1 Tax=Diploscapter pachys TaxID=2018661 RepID=A0A2A2M2Z4_9BILA|nr:hypothetical protein WR25_02231 [Diploscapter pachys]
MLRPVFANTASARHVASLRSPCPASVSSTRTCRSSCVSRARRTSPPASSRFTSGVIVLDSSDRRSAIAPIVRPSSSHKACSTRYCG